jgi:hypothetical protein
MKVICFAFTNSPQRKQLGRRRGGHWGYATRFPPPALLEAKEVVCISERLTTPFANQKFYILRREENEI